MSRLLYRWGRWSARRPWVAIAAWLAATVIVVAASASFGRVLEESNAAPGTDSQAAADLLAEAGADGITAYVVAQPADGGPFDARDVDLAELESGLADLPHVLGVSHALSADDRTAVVTLQYPAIDQLAKADLDALEDLLDEQRGTGALDLEAGGDLHFNFGGAPTNVGEMLGIGVALVILVVAFGSLLAAGLPVAIALLGLLVGASALPLVAYLVDIPVWTTAMAAMVGLGVGIDYALFLLTRFREQLDAGMAVPDAVGRALATAGQSIVLAGGIVVLAILGLVVAGLPFVTAGGIGIAVVVLVMVLAATTLLPALLGLAGTRLAGRGRLARRQAASVARWARWGRHVTRHATAYAAGGAVLLLALAAPLLGMRLGLPDQGSYPEERTERRAHDLVAEAFGPGATGPLVVAVAPGAGETTDAAAARVAGALRSDPGIAGVAEPQVFAGSDVAAVVAQPTTSPQDAETRATVTRLRQDVLPGAVEGATAHIGGYPATIDDLGARVADRLPAFVVAVVLLSFLLLVVVFRSVLVPLKAAVLNLLSVGAAYGVIVMVFQWGWGADLIGLESTIPVISFIPLFMFAILFGLSMDYEVFLLSRIREEYLRTGDADHAIVHGVGVTARTISSAAAIMVAVFSGFVLGADPILKMLGLGLATAVLLDATVVRLVLVPATMKLLGRRAWWLPSWLDRRMPTLDVEPAPLAPATATSA
ncbi:MULTISPECIES: MMPL family transporter [unclassified Nocardioides]|uniref:MMPL family transporter n=1 Tax=unclassified Nocardioides TaxID=2615069 RepID=UPI0036126581